MANSLEIHPPAAVATAALRERGRHRLRFTFFTLEALNSLAAAYYFNYLFFYMGDHFGFGNRQNLLLTVLHGFFYTLSAGSAGRFAHRFGHLFALWVGFGGMGLALLIGSLLPHFLGFSRSCLLAELGVLLLWTFSMCLTWPTLQALLSRHEAPGEMARTAGTYNVVWSSCAAVSYLTGGALLERFGGETLFWVPVGLHVLELLLLLTLPGEKILLGAKSAPSPAATPAKPALNPRPISRVRTFLYLGWLANPFAYMAINGILPVIPQLADHLGLSHAAAGLVCSVWFWVRLATFIFLYLWPGWHYRFRWLLAAFIALSLSFTGILLSPNIALLILAQVVFGCAVGLIYYSSLFYSMDGGESTGKRGGFHEAAIGLGVFGGPAVGASALAIWPHAANAGVLAIGTVLALGLLPFLWIYRRGRAGAVTALPR